VVQLSEQQIIDQVAQRLAGMYPSVPADTVARIVHERYAVFDGSRIRDFVPMFVEKRARAQLAALAV
jgi:hypothetical protein